MGLGLAAPQSAMISPEGLQIIFGIFSPCGFSVFPLPGISIGGRNVAPSFSDTAKEKEYFSGWVCLI